MKSILLTSTALVAFAGAAAAEISFTGEATLGYNTTEGVNDVEVDGFFWDSSVDVTMQTELDNGLTASATVGLSFVEDNVGDAVESSDFVLSLSSELASLTFGDIDPVAEDREGFVDGSSTADFNDQDVHFSDAVGFESILVGEVTVAGFTAAASLGVDSNDATAEEDVDALQVHIGGTVSVVDLEFAYQQEFAGTPEIFGVGASASFVGADFEVSYLQSGETATADEESSIGLAVAYPFGPVTVAAYYSINDIAEDNFGVDLDYSANGLSVNVFADVDGGEDGADDVTDFGIEGSYEVGNGLEVFAGYISSDVDDAADLFYVAAEYDLGGGAEILFSYADDGDEAVPGEDLGDPEYMEGATIEVSFEF